MNELRPVCDYCRQQAFTPEVMMDAIRRIELKRHINRAEVA